MFKKYSIVQLLFLLITISSVGQGRLNGTVTDAGSGEPLARANVILGQNGFATITDNDGQFAFGNIKTGHYQLKVSYVGYETYSEDIEVRGTKSKLNIKLEPKTYMGEEVIISAIRAGNALPPSVTKLNAMQIEKKNTGKDLPFILESLPSTVVTSDAGNGVGYTGIRIRGTDLTGINVTLNGVPVNDAESQGVFFVDLPDLASSVDDMEVQRGVGVSTNGAASFGASINIKTGEYQSDPYATVSSAAGSFNTFKNTMMFGSGLIKSHWVFDGRLSFINSGGYIDRASSELRSYSLSGGYFGKNDVIKAIVLNGKEKTYQAWYGVPADSLTTNRTYNPAGEILDQNGNLLGYYDNQTDNYQQTYYQAHWGHRFSEKINSAVALFYTRGLGYYENYRNDRSFSSYGMNDTVIGGDTISNADMIDQKWLDNYFYGINISSNYHSSRVKIDIGTGYNRYEGKHYGYVIWSQVARIGEYDNPWYNNTGYKDDFNLFAKAQFFVTPGLDAFVDLQYRYINYRIDGTHDDLRDLSQTHVYSFFNPKIGLEYRINNNNSINLYGGIANREPNRSVFRDADTSQDIHYEQLFDLEAGYRYQVQNLTIHLNGFYMYYKNQFVLTGKINNVGAPIMTNVPSSYRTGIEFIGNWHLLKLVDWHVNATVSSNKITDFVGYTDDWTNWPDQVVDTIGKTNISFSPQVTLSSNISVKPIKNLTLSLISNYVGKQFIDNTSNDNRSLDPYFVNNLAVYYSLDLKAIKGIDFWLTVYNIFNEQYETNAWVYPYYYDDVEYEMNGYFPQAGIHLMGGVNIKF